MGHIWRHDHERDVSLGPGVQPAARQLAGRQSDLFCGGSFDTDNFKASEQCCVCGGGLTEEESPFDGIDVGGISAPTFADLDDDCDPDLVPKTRRRETARRSDASSAS